MALSAEGEAFGGKAWDDLVKLSVPFAERVKSAFPNIETFCASIVDEADAITLVQQVMTGLLKQEQIRNLGSNIWIWCCRHQALQGRLLRKIRAAVESGPYLKVPPKVDAAETYQNLVNDNPLLGLAVLEKKLKQNKQLLSVESKQAKEEAMKQKWVLRLTAYLVAAALPSVSRIQAMDDPSSAWLRAFGSRRGSTLKNRALAWEPFFRWIEQAEGRTWPSGAASVLQYLQERYDGGTLHKTTPAALLASLYLLEQVGQVPAEKRLSSDALVDAAIKSWSAELEAGAKPIRKAPMFTVAILLSLEMTLARLSVENGLRYACFMVLIMVWSALRCDDLQNIDPASVTFSQLGLKFNILRTKTSGPGKKQGTLQGFVLRGVSLSGYDWLATGMSLLQSDEFKFPRDFLCVHLDDKWQVSSKDYLEPEGVASLVRAVLRALHAPKRVDGKWGLSKTVHLVPENLVTFWSGHSPRHVLPSLAAAVGIPEERINFLGRWAAAKSASSTYIMTSRQVVHQIQAQICQAILEGQPAPGLVEEELFQQMQQHVISKGGDGSHASAGHQVLTWDSASSSWSLRAKFPAISVDPSVLQQATGTTSSPEAPDVEATDEAPYFVTVSRSGFRRLHVSKACAVRQERCLEWVPIHVVTADCADAICKLCKPKVNSASAVSSPSASDSEEGIAQT